MDYADLVVWNGPVITMDPSRGVVEALAVKDGLIVAAGSKPEVQRLIGPSTVVVDLGGRACTPGLINTHDHFIEQGVSSAYTVDIRYPKAKSIKEIKGLLAERAENSPPGQWIIGHAWDETLLEEGRFPTRFDLDEACPNNPVYIKRVFQMGVANSLALEMAGVTGDTPDPEFGVIERGPDGEPTGLLRGRATSLVTDRIEWSLEERVEAVKAACRDYLSQGFTLVVEPGILDEGVEALREARRRGLLSLRVQVQIGFLRSLGEVEDAVQRFPVGGDDVLRITGLKMAVDGGVGPRTALFYEDYRGMPGVRGEQLLDARELREMVELGHREGFQVAIHAIGDKAIDIAMDAYEYAQGASPRPDPRHQIVHCYFPTPKALKQIVELGVVVNTQTPFLYFLGDSFVEALGLERCRGCMPVKTLNALGVPVGISHDATVTPPLPSVGLYASTTRRTIRGVELGRGEAVDVLTALSFYTTQAAKHCFMEDKLGKIAPGYLADLAVWNFNPLEAEGERLLEWRCEMTFVGGRLAYRREPEGKAENI